MDLGTNNCITTGKCTCIYMDKNYFAYLTRPKHSRKTKQHITCICIYMYMYMYVIGFHVPIHIHVHVGNIWMHVWYIALKDSQVTTSALYEIPALCYS